MDAVVIRAMIVPALMQLLGRSDWWFPGWLDRILPQVSVQEPAPARPASLAVPVTYERKAHRG